MSIVTKVRITLAQPSDSDFFLGVSLGLQCSPYVCVVIEEGNNFFIILFGEI